MVAWQPTSQEIAATAGALAGVILSNVMAPDAPEASGRRTGFPVGGLSAVRILDA